MSTSPRTQGAAHQRLVAAAFQQPRPALVRQSRIWLANYAIEARRPLVVALLSLFGFLIVARPSKALAHSRGSTWLIVRLATAAGEIDDKDFVVTLEAVRSSELGLQVICGASMTGLQPRDALTEISGFPVELRRIAMRRLGVDPAFKAMLPATVHQAIVLDGAAALGGDLLDLMILQVGRSAPGLTDRQAVMLFRALLTLATPPLDPYDRNSKRLAASNAIVQLAVNRPEVAKELLAVVTSEAGERRTGALELLARVIRGRTEKRSELFLTANSSLRLTVPERSRLAEQADVSQRAATSLNRTALSNDNKRRWIGALPRLTSAGLVLLAPVALVVIWRNPSLGDDLPAATFVASIALEVALATLAVIATIHVFTVQLSMQRLPGTVARVAGQPRPLLAAYSAALTLLLACLCVPQPKRVEWPYVQTALLAFAVAMLCLALVRIFGATASADACRVYVDRNLSRWRKASRRYGRAQRECRIMQRSLESLPFVRIGGGPMVGHDVWRIVAPNRGLFMPKRRETMRALCQPIFADGASLQLQLVPGLVASAGAPVVLIRTADGRPLDRRQEGSLLGAFRPVAAFGIEEMSSQATSLAAFALTTSSTGDTRLGEAIAEQAARVVESHLAAAARARSSRSRVSRGSESATNRTWADSEIYPADPVLQDTLRLVVAGSPGIGDATGKAADVIVRRCLDASGAEDNAPTMLCSLLSGIDFGNHSSELVSGWLRRAGTSALRLRQSYAFDRVVGSFSSLAGEERERSGMRALAALGTDAAYLDASALTVVWSAFTKWTPAAIGASERTRLTMQIGAAALDAGAFSSALACARAIVDVGQLATLDALTGPGRISAEATLIHIEGIFVGDVVTDSLERFRDLAKTL